MNKLLIKAFFIILVLEGSVTTTKALPRTEARYQTDEYLVRNVRLSNSKNKKNLYTSRNDRNYNQNVLNELRNRMPDRQTANVRSVVKEVKKQKKEQLNSATLRTIKKLKESLTEKNMLSAAKNRYKDYSSIIKLQKDSNQNAIDRKKIELSKIKNRPEYKSAVTMGIGTLSNKQKEKYAAQLTLEKTKKTELAALQKKNASYERADKYLGGMEKVLNTYDKINELDKRRTEYLNKKKQSASNDGYKSSLDKASELRTDVDYKKDAIKDLSTALAAVNDYAKDKAGSASKDADKDIRKMMTEFRDNPEKFNIGGKAKKEELLNNLRKWDDNKKLEKITDGLSSGVKFTQSAIEKFEKAEKIIDTGTKLLENQDKDTKRIGGMEYVSGEMKDGMKKYSAVKNVLNAAADYLPEGPIQETAKTGVKVMETIEQAANYGNQLEESKMQGGKYDKDGNFLTKDKDLADDINLTARQNMDNSDFTIPDGSGGEVTISSAEFEKLKDTISAVSGIEGKNPDQERIAEMAAAIKDNRPFPVETSYQGDDGSIEKETILIGANQLLSANERDKQEFQRDRYNETSEFFDKTLQNSELENFGGKKFEDLTPKEQSRLSEKRERLNQMMEATGRNRDQLTPNIMNNILGQEEKDKENLTTFEGNMINKLQEMIGDPNTSGEKKAEYEYLLLQELEKIKKFNEANKAKEKKEKKKGSDEGEQQPPPVVPKKEPEDKPDTEPGTDPEVEPEAEPGTEPEIKTPPEKDPGDDTKSERTSKLSADLIQKILEAGPGADKQEIIKEYLRNLRDKKKNNPENNLRKNEDETQNKLEEQGGGDSPNSYGPPNYDTTLDTYTGYQDDNTKSDFASVQESSQAGAGETEVNLASQQNWWNNDLFSQQMNLDDNLRNLTRIGEATREQAQWDRKNSWSTWFQDLLNNTAQSAASGFGGSFGTRIGSNLVEREIDKRYPENDCNDGDSSSDQTTKPPVKPTSEPNPTRSCSIGPDNNGDGICDVCGGSMRSKKKKKPVKVYSQSGC